MTREQVHRRVLLLGIGALILLSMSPVFGHHFASGLEQGLEGQDHLGPLCLVALHELMAPVHFLFHALIVGGLLYAAYDRFRAWQAVHRVLAPLEVMPPSPGDPFWTAARAARVDPHRIRIVEGLPNPAFTVGWVRPLIYVARALGERLPSGELAAVLGHEGAHVARRDPLRLSLLRFFAHTLFWIPALRRLADDVADEAEIRADDAAARGRPLVLASAILALAGWASTSTPLNEAIGFAQRRDLLDRRIRRLAGEEPPVGTRVTRGSLAGALFALALAWTSGAIMAHPLPAEASPPHAPHCEHPGELAVEHLFCSYHRLPSMGDTCPHLLSG